MNGLRRLLAVAAAAPVVLLAAGNPTANSSPASNQSTAVDCTAFAAIQSYRAQFSFSFQAAHSFVDSNNQCSYQVSDSQAVSVTADLVQTTQAFDEVWWEGPIQGHVSFDDLHERSCPPSSQSASATIRASGAGPPIIPGGGAAPKLTLVVNLQQCTYEVINTGFWVAGTLEAPGTNGQIVLPMDIGTGAVVTGKQPVGLPQDRIQFNRAIPAYYGPTTEPYFFPVSGATGALAEIAVRFGPDLGTAAASWSFDPEELELVVDPEDYDAWMPEGIDFYSASGANAPEDEIGTSIDVVATVRRKSDGLPPQNSTVQSIDFVLVQSSAEPGIALNTPPRARLKASQPKDLQFDPALNAALQPPVVVSPGDTSRAQATSGVGNTATAKLSAYDWGAFGELEVTATLDNGYALQGHLVSDASMERIRLPKRDANSHIADEWKQQHGVAGKADDADDEDNPGGSGFDVGDGLSLYEEYRGFFVGEAHRRGDRRRETDPNKKDLFVKNEYGPVLVPGFKLLADGGGLQIHHELSDDEIDAGRVVNYNRGQGAHVVDQHGVRVEQGDCGKDVRGHAFGNPALRLLPRSTTRVCIASRVLSQGTSIAIRPAQEMHRIVAHEVAHAVGVEHHGETDLGIVLWTLDPATNLVMEQSRLGSYPIEVRAESQIRPMNAQELAGLFAISQVFAQLDPYVGSARGQHSGVDHCFMRYDAANAYTLEPTQQSTPRVRWWVAKEGSGTGMDDSATGTGVNAASRSPRSRYGDACTALGRGDCRHQILVSDALPDFQAQTNGGAACP
jgi:hypothetical protein